LELPKGRRASLAALRYTAVIDQWTPDLGKNNLDVFHRILRLGEAEVERLHEAKVIW